MKIYKFCYNQFQNRISKEEIEAEEKKKTYMLGCAGCRSMINKDSIGHVDFYNNLFLLEDNEKLAIGLFLEKMGNELSVEKDKVKAIEARMEKLNIRLHELRDFKEDERMVSEQQRNIGGLAEWVK